VKIRTEMTENYIQFSPKGYSGPISKITVLYFRGCYPISYSSPFDFSYIIIFDTYKKLRYLQKIKEYKKLIFGDI